MLPASFILTNEFDNIEAQPFTSGGFADLYRATYKGQQVVVKALKNASAGEPDSENVRKVGSIICGRIVQFAHAESSALYE